MTQSMADADSVGELQSFGLTPEQWGRIGDQGWWEIEPGVGRVADGVSMRVDRLKGLGNAVVPAQAREAFKRLSGLN